MDSKFLANDLTLEQKLALIDEKMNQLQQAENKKARDEGRAVAPIDPSSLTVCDGCE